jgi:glycosyltransferase involved in cell wall biosynthesis
MKVLHVIDSLGVGGGAEHSLAAQLPGLQERGVESSVVCLLPRTGGLEAEIREMGFPVTVLPSDRWIGRVRSLRDQIIASRPDLVHATLMKACIASRIACRGLRCAQINSIVNTSYDPVRTRELRISRSKLRLLQSIDRMTARSVDEFHAISTAVRDEAVKILGVAPESLTVIPRGRSLSQLGRQTPARRAHVRDALSIPSSSPVVLNVARQDAQKAQPVLVGAFAKVLGEHPDALLLIAGREGDASNQIRDAVASTGVGNRVRLLGHRTDVPDLLAAADVFAFPSLYEGLGGAMLEALALGVPIIGSDAPAIAEVLGEGSYGVVVPRANEEALARGLSELLADPVKRVQLSAAGRARFLAYYELGTVTDATVAMYERVLHRRHGPEGSREAPKHPARTNPKSAPAE